MLRRILAFAAVAALSCAIPMLLFDDAETASAQDAAVPMPRDALGLRLTVGIGDDQGADWSGQASSSGGWGSGAVEFEVRTERPPSKKNQPRRAIPAAVQDLTLPGAGDVQVNTGQGSFRFDSATLSLGRSAAFLDGRATVERTPAVVSPASGPLDEDFVAAAADAQGGVWAAYVEYAPGAAVDEAATHQGRYDSLVAKGNGDRIRLMHLSGGAWRPVGAVTDAGRDVQRPTVVAVGADVWVVWSEQVDENWDLYARRYDAQRASFDRAQRLTDAPGTDFNPVAAHDGKGRAWVAWQGWRNGQFDVLLAQLGADAEPLQVSSSPRNDWNPAIASNGDGSVWVAWDTYDQGTYDVFVRRVVEGRPDAPIAVASSAAFEARASVAVDAKGRPWVAFEEGPENWGKDYGDRWTGRNGAPFYLDRYIDVRVVEGGRVLETADYQAPLIETFDDDPRKPTDLRHRISMPRLAFDPAGRAWLLYRRHTEKSGLGERWASYAAHYDGAEWSREIPLPRSINLLDQRPALVAHDGALLALYSSDHRVSTVRDRTHNDLYAAYLDAGQAAAPPVLTEVRPEGHTRAAMPIHPNEAADIARVRAQRVILGGKTYRYVRGEFHRHTEISSHRDWDGPLEEVFRYGLDVAAMDWIGPGDHDFGYGQDYLWWLTQKQVDLFRHPGVFQPMYTYERSQVYPSGHRNVMFAQRGVRPLPRLPSREQQFGTEQGGSADIRNLYSYLKHFGAICSSHTSATNMGTDWRDSDPEVEPVVEIFQGHRLSAEETNAPMAPRNESEAIQGYQPKGFVWEAFKKGVRLGFQASSDHVSTHISYGMALVENDTPEALIDAFKRRHSYAAQDNVILDVRSGEHMMGDEFRTSARPSLDIRVLGTTPIRKVDIIRQIEGESPVYVAAFEPGEAEVQFTWTDRDARPGKVNMYYVRIQQANEALAWASPLWIDYRP
ncbi:MAG: hypothetical protein KDC27_15540 [Acidobacteria bacterium]|nr:hypothetical protein [Acidobacteriota bacterium]